MQADKEGQGKAGQMQEADGAVVGIGVGASGTRTIDAVGGGNMGKARQRRPCARGTNTSSIVGRQALPYRSRAGWRGRRMDE